jgi:hypothetical protein
MSDKWSRVRDVRGFLADRGTKRVRAHEFSRRILHWPYCKHCGLIPLKNVASQKAASSPCVTYE